MSETLLIVDDSPTNIEVLYKTLESPKYRILVARDGETALAIVASQKPTLVLLDIMMPGMDGFEVCEAIKSNPDTARTAVIFLSALGDTDAKVKGFQLGGVDYISKPFQAEEVVVRVSNHVRIQQLERDLEQRNAALTSDLERILATMQEGVYGLDEHGLINFSNLAASKLTGFDAVELAGIAVFDTHFGLCEGSDKLLVKPMATLAKNKKLTADCVKVRTKTERECFVEIEVSPNFVDGVFEGGVMVFRDITKRVVAEQALAEAREELLLQRQRMAHVERLSTMGEMAAGLAHEVNQPLTAINNYASVSVRLLSQPDFDLPKVQETLDKLQIQAIRASDVVQRLRDFAKAPKNNKVIKNINLLTRSVIELAEVDSRKLGVDIQFTASTKPVAVYVDDVQIQQVALNLIRNAMEATVQKPDSVSYIEIIATVEKDAVQLLIRDYGIGLAADAEEKLFTPFYTTKPNGMGVGLSVCESIMAEHGGGIEFERKDPGTLFVMSLPVYD